MFIIDMKKGFRISFVINIILLVLFIMMAIMYFMKGTDKKELNPGLQTLMIEEAPIDFKPNRYAYSIDVNSDVNKLTLSLVSYEKGANIKIDGNENLKEGYNQIVITVSDSATTPKLYYIDVNKVSKTKNNNENNNQEEEKDYTNTNIQ